MLVSKAFYNTKLNTKNIFNKEILEQTLQTFANNINRLWFKYSKVVNITKHLKTWWNDDCYRNLEKYRISKWLEDWKIFKDTYYSSKILEPINE